MRVHYLQHSSFDEPGIIENWVTNHAHDFTGTKVYAHEKIPDPDTFDFLIILGGPQSFLHTNKPSFLYDELNLIRKAIAEKKIVLGICLGAQMIAESLGAKTTHSPYPEIGIFPVILPEQAQHDRVFKYLPKEFPAMHMHYDMASLPQGARLLASSKGCPIQAFAIGDRTYALQFHLEITKENIEFRLNHMGEMQEEGRYISTRHDLINADLSQINQRMLLILDVLASTN